MEGGDWARRPVSESIGFIHIFDLRDFIVAGRSGTGVLGVMPLSGRSAFSSGRGGPNSGTGEFGLGLGELFCRRALSLAGSLLVESTVGLGASTCCLERFDIGRVGDVRPRATLGWLDFRIEAEVFVDEIEFERSNFGEATPRIEYGALGEGGPKSLVEDDRQTNMEPSSQPAHIVPSTSSASTDSKLLVEAASTVNVV